MNDQTVTFLFLIILNCYNAEKSKFTGNYNKDANK